MLHRNSRYEVMYDVRGLFFYLEENQITHVDIIWCWNLYGFVYIFMILSLLGPYCGSDVELELVLSTYKGCKYYVLCGL